MVKNLRIFLVAISCLLLNFFCNAVLCNAVKLVLEFSSPYIFIQMYSKEFSTLSISYSRCKSMEKVDKSLRSEFSRLIMLANKKYFQVVPSDKWFTSVEARFKADIFILPVAFESYDEKILNFFSQQLSKGQQDFSLDEVDNTLKKVLSVIVDGFERDAFKKIQFS